MSAERITQGIDCDLAEHFQILDTRFLVAIHHGDVDVVHLARQELMNAGHIGEGAGLGLPKGGEWLGLYPSRHACSMAPATFRRLLHTPGAANAAPAIFCVYGVCRLLIGVFLQAWRTREGSPVHTSRCSVIVRRKSRARLRLKLPQQRQRSCTWL